MVQEIIQNESLRKIAEVIVFASVCILFLFLLIALTVAVSMIIRNEVDEHRLRKTIRRRMYESTDISNREKGEKLD